jgi:DNA ligase-1
LHKLPADIIIELESNNSRIFKESIIIREMESRNDQFIEGVRYACDKLITFGVSDKTVPYKEKNDDIPVDNISFNEFKDYLEKFVNREITGNAARDILTEICNKTSSHTWNNWYRRILLKDLKCGVDSKTINNCAKKINEPKFSIPIFSCQLAFDSNLHESKVVGKKIVETKLDGVRILTIVYPNGVVDQFSRNGKEILNFQLIKNQLTSISKTLDEPMVFDGEIMSSSFQDLMTQFYRKESVNTTDANLFIFDMIPLEDFKRGIYNIKQINRTERLHRWFNINKALLFNVKVLQYEIVDLSDTFGKERFEKINQKAIDEGYEGIMLKEPYSPYECKRSTAWLKLKPVLTMDLTITDIEEGNDKYSGILGALVCQGEEDGKKIFVNVGSGFSDEQRKNYWDNKSELIGKIVEVKCDAITKNQEGTYSLRFPRFVKLRGFGAGEKL